MTDDGDALRAAMPRSSARGNSTPGGKGAMKQHGQSNLGGLEERPAPGHGAVTQVTTGAPTALTADDGARQKMDAPHPANMAGVGHTEHTGSGARRAPPVPSAGGPPLIQGHGANSSGGEYRWTESATRWQEEANVFVREVIETRSVDVTLLMGRALTLRLDGSGPEKMAAKKDWQSALSWAQSTGHGAILMRCGKALRRDAGGLMAREQYDGEHAFQCALGEAVLRAMDSTFRAFDPDTDTPIANFDDECRKIRRMLMVNTWFTLQEITSGEISVSARDFLFPSERRFIDKALFGRALKARVAKEVEKLESIVRGKRSAPRSPLYPYTVGSERSIVDDDAAVNELWAEETNTMGDVLDFVKKELTDDDGDLTDCWPETPDLPDTLPLHPDVIDGWSDGGDGGGDGGCDGGNAGGACEEKSGCQSPVMEPPQEPVWEQWTVTAMPEAPWLIPSSDPDDRPEVCCVELQAPEDGGAPRQVERWCRHERERERGKDVHPTSTS